MSTEIKITDPHLMPVKHLARLIAFLQDVHNDLLGVGAVHVVPATPLVPPAPVVHSIAGAEVASTAPVASTDSLPAPTTAFALAAPTTAFAPAIAPMPPAAPPVPPVSGGAVELDTEGLPWDGRIHSSKQSKITDGTWKIKRGTGDVYIAEVKAQLRAAMAAPAAPVVPVAAIPPAAPAAPPAPPLALVPAAPPAPPLALVPDAPPAPPAAPVVPPAPPVAGPMLFKDLMPKITAAITAGHLTQEQVQTAVTQAGLPSLPMLAARADLVQTVANALGIV